MHEGLGSSTEAKAIGGHLDGTRLRGSYLIVVFGGRVEYRSVSCCDACQKAGTKMDNAAPSLYPVSVLQHLWMQIGVDLCNLSQNAEHYVGICVAADYFSRGYKPERL